MISAKDINNRQFEQTRPGYKPEEVDSFLREIAMQITQYQRDKEEAEKKIEVLVESVREYKKDEEALKDALIAAQKQSRAIIAEAQSKAADILADANVRAKEIIGSTTVQLEKEKRCLAKMQQEVSDFKASLLSMYKEHLNQITAIPDYDDDSSDEEEAPVQAAVRQPQPEAAPAVQPVIQPEQPAPAAVPEENIESTRVIDNPFKSEKSSFPFDEPASVSASRTENKFGELKFGQNK